MKIIQEILFVNIMNTINKVIKTENEILSCESTFFSRLLSTFSI